MSQRNSIGFVEFTVILAGAILVIASLFYLGGTIDDLEAEQRLYCKRVAEGRWPDFNKNYKEVCVDGQSESN